MSPRELEGLAIFATHGLLDAATTAIAALAHGVAAEQNPLIRLALEEGVGYAIGIIIGIVGLVAIAYPSVARRYDFPLWFPLLLVVVGVGVAFGNIAYSLGWVP